MKITTNNCPRDIVYGFELSDKERAEFDWLDADEIESAEFFRYKGRVYSFDEFMRVGNIDTLQGWDGYTSDSFFSGIVIKYPRLDYSYAGHPNIELDTDHVIVGWYCS